MMAHLASRTHRFAGDEDGATLVEFAIVLAIFMFIFFGLIDFARLGFSNVLAEKATEKAVRMAVVRPAICDDVPVVNQRGLVGVLSLDLPNGTPCSARQGLCVSPGVTTCTGTLDNPTVATIWGQVQPLLPVNTRPENLAFSYSYDANLNRVGAAYTPIVTVALADLQFDFISPLGALARLSGAQNADELGASFLFPSMSASLPAEDLR